MYIGMITIQQILITQHVKEDQITFHGSRLKDNTVNEPHENMPEHWVGYCYAWGYADNHPNGEEQCKFKNRLGSR